MKKLLFILILFMVFIFAKSYSIGPMEQTIYINLDGTVDINETISYSFNSGEFHEVYRTIPLSWREGTFEILEYQVYEDEKPINTRIDKIGNNKIELIGYSTWENEVHNYTFSYKISNIIVCYTDVCDFYWKLK